MELIHQLICAGGFASAGKRFTFKKYDFVDRENDVDNAVDYDFNLGELITCRHAFVLQLLSFFPKDLLRGFFLWADGALLIFIGSMCLVLCE